ncbi:hypothetical protein, partial [Bacillus aquiflavi]|uniref:hypothetical protein n=1 Tax=Bacillus aquiflavi TaxID=2672567 RepID=UPI001C55546C
ALFILIEPPYTEPYVRWCERSGANHPLLLDLSVHEGFFTTKRLRFFLRHKTLVFARNYLHKTR